MTRSNDLALRKAFLGWCDTSGWKNPVAVTLTLKQAIRSRWGTFIRPGPGDYEQNLRHFLNVLNRRIYGNKVRHGARLKCIAVLEGDDIVRRHYHLLIDIPPRRHPDSFMILVALTWGETLWGYHVQHVTPCDSGWLPYMAKLKSKAEYSDAIDWLNCHK